jgi:hypothetical protein
LLIVTIPVTLGQNDLGVLKMNDTDVMQLYKQVQVAILDQCRGSHWRDQALFRLQESLWWYRAAIKTDEPIDG